jgi:hypothetical protein
VTAFGPETMPMKSALQAGSVPASDNSPRHDRPGSGGGTFGQLSVSSTEATCLPRVDLAHACTEARKLIPIKAVPDHCAHKLQNTQSARSSARYAAGTQFCTGVQVKL